MTLHSFIWKNASNTLHSNCSSARQIQTSAFTIFFCAAVDGTVIRWGMQPQNCVEHLVLKNLHIVDIDATWTFILSSKALCKLKTNSFTVSVIGVS